MRTSFTSFHHMDIDSAKAILKNAIDSQEAIGIFEMTENSIPDILRLFITVYIAAFFIIPFTKPNSFKKILLTPISAFTTWWDAMASCLRTYSVKELNEMIQDVDMRNKYQWEVGKKFSHKDLCNITYLIGYPKN